LKWLYPFFENGQRDKVTYTVEIKFENGLVTLHIFIVGQDKDYNKAVEKVRQSRQTVDTWLMRKDYSFEVITSDQLIRKYMELDFSRLHPSRIASVIVSNRASVGVLSIEDKPTNLSDGIDQLLQQLPNSEISGYVLISFTSGPTPRLDNSMKALQTDPQKQPRIPHRVEEHQLRKIYKQMAEVEAAEETGSFRVAMSVIIEGKSVDETDSALKYVESIVRSVWGGVKTKVIPASRLCHIWSRYLLRNTLLRTISMSGARLTALLHISKTIP
jgi:hypothetical protein